MGVGAQVDPAGDDAGLELRRAVAAGAERPEGPREVGHEKVGGRGVGPQLLFEAEEAGVRAEVPGPQKPELAVPEDVGAGLETLHDVGDQVGLDQVSAGGCAVGWDPGRGEPEGRGEDLCRDRPGGHEHAGGAAAPDDLLQGVGGPVGRKHWRLHR